MPDLQTVGKALRQPEKAEQMNRLHGVAQALMVFQAA